MLSSTVIHLSRSDEAVRDIQDLLMWQLSLESRGGQNSIRCAPGPLGATRLTFTEAGVPYLLVLSESFLLNYPAGLANSVIFALSYLGDYLRASADSALLLTDKHAFERWTNDTLRS